MVSDKGNDGSRLTLHQHSLQTEDARMHADGVRGNRAEEAAKNVSITSATPGPAVVWTASLTSLVTGSGHSVAQ